MELAKVTSKGQVTIPIEIRKKLGIKNGRISGSPESICRRGRKTWT